MTRRRPTLAVCAFATTAALSLAGCVARQPDTAVPAARVHPAIVWRVAEGDLVRLRVYRQPELSGETLVGTGGTAFFAGLGRIAVAGLALDSLESLLNARYTSVIRDPAVQVTLVRDVVLLGQVRAPGVYGVDPGLTLLGLLAKAGGPISTSGSPSVTLLKADGTRYTLPREARLGTIDINRTDAVQISDDSFFVRNQATIGAAALVVSTLSTLVSVILIVTR